MNIFVLDSSPEMAAAYHCDKHVIKMTLESAQILCTVMRHYGFDAPYKETHKNHPCTIWAMQSSANFLWLWRLMKALNDEYMLRYGKSEPHLAWAKIRNNPIPMKAIPYPSKVQTKFAQAMPAEYKDPDPVKAYRAYYLGSKVNLLQYTRRRPPPWIPDGVAQWRGGPYAPWVP